MLLVWLLCLDAPQACEVFGPPHVSLKNFELMYGVFAPAFDSSTPTTSSSVARTSAEDVLKAAKDLTRIETLGQPSTRDPKVALKDSMRRTMLPALRHLFGAALNYANRYQSPAQLATQIIVCAGACYAGFCSG